MISYVIADFYLIPNHQFYNRSKFPIAKIIQLLFCITLILPERKSCICSINDAHVPVKTCVTLNKTLEFQSN